MSLRLDTTTLRAGLALVALLAVGCEDAALDGSLGEAYALDFDHVRGRLNPDGLAIEYVDVHGAVPVRVTLTSAPEDIHTGRYDLLTEGDVTGETYDGFTILRFSDGRLDLDTFELREGGTVAGSFSANFPVDTTQGERTLTLNGRFDTVLELNDWIDPITGPQCLPDGGGMIDGALPLPDGAICPGTDGGLPDAATDASDGGS